MAFSAASLSRDLSSLSGLSQAGRGRNSIDGDAFFGLSKLPSSIAPRQRVADVRMSGVAKSFKAKQENFAVSVRSSPSSNVGRRGAVQAAEQTEGVTEAEREGWEKRMVSSWNSRAWFFGKIRYKTMIHYQWSTRILNHFVGVSGMQN